MKILDLMFAFAPGWPSDLGSQTHKGYVAVLRDEYLIIMDTTAPSWADPSRKWTNPGCDNALHWHPGHQEVQKKLRGWSPSGLLILEANTEGDLNAYAQAELFRRRLGRDGSFCSREELPATWPNARQAPARVRAFSQEGA